LSNYFRSTSRELNPGRPGCCTTWEIQYGDSVCSLPWGLEGLHLIREILSGGHVGGCPAPFASTLNDTDAEIHEKVGDYAKPHAMRALPVSTIKRLIDELSQGAAAAWASGNRLRYDELTRQAQEARRYLRDTTGLGNRSRRFPDEWSRQNDAERKTLDRAVSAIHKQSPLIAKHLKTTIIRDDAGWHYAGLETWDTRTDHFGELLDVESSVPGRLERPAIEEVEAASIRRNWLAKKIESSVVRAAIDAFRSKTGTDPRDRSNENLERNIARWEKDCEAKDVTKTPAEIAKETLEKNRRRYPGRDENFIFQQTRQEVRDLIDAQIRRKHVQKASSWWSV
jgi:hypothetical protein